MERGKIEILSNACALLLLAGLIVFMLPSGVITTELLKWARVFTAIAGFAGIVFVLTAGPVMRRDPITWAVSFLLIIASLFELAS